MTVMSNADGDRVLWWCPACDCAHAVPVKPGDPNGWDFNGDMESPTLAPSVLVYEHKASPPFRDQPRCHTFIRKGNVEFLSDCSHALAGRTVPLVPLNEGENDA